MLYVIFLSCGIDVVLPAPADVAVLLLLRSTVLNVLTRHTAASHLRPFSEQTQQRDWDGGGGESCRGFNGITQANIQLRRSTRSSCGRGFPCLVLSHMPCPSDMM